MYQLIELKGGGGRFLGWWYLFMCASEGKEVLGAHHSLIVPLHKPATPKIKKYGKNKYDKVYL
jgi:hypothetical protein